MSKLNKKDLDILWSWLMGKSWKELGFKHPIQCERFLKTQIKKLLVNEDVKQK